MINKSKIARLLTLSIAATAFVLVSAAFSEANAQTRDPFAKPGWARPKDPRTGMPGKPGSPSNVNLGIPSIEQRIDYYKRLRESAALAGQPIPKVTSVLSLSEMAVTGIFHTPRGYAAMVEATPIRLSYTIYPGEKFFDGQLVAVDENRLVFRKVTKTSNGKFVSTVENKPLRQYTQREQIQGTAPAGYESAGNEPPKPPENTGADAKITSLVSPLDEMNKQAAAPEKTKADKPAKKPVRVAKKSK